MTFLLRTAAAVLLAFYCLDSSFSMTLKNFHSEAFDVTTPVPLPSLMPSFN